MKYNIWQSYTALQKVRALADFFKVLSDELNISLVFTWPSLLLSACWGLNEQLRGRSLATELIYPYSWISAADRQDFAARYCACGCCVQ